MRNWALGIFFVAVWIITIWALHTPTHHGVTVSIGGVKFADDGNELPLCWDIEHRRAGSCAPFK